MDFPESRRVEATSQPMNKINEINIRSGETGRVSVVGRSSLDDIKVVTRFMHHDLRQFMGGYRNGPGAVELKSMPRINGSC